MFRWRVPIAFDGSTCIGTENGGSGDSGGPVIELTSCRQCETMIMTKVASVDFPVCKSQYSSREPSAPRATIVLNILAALHYCGSITQPCVFDRDQQAEDNRAQTIYRAGKSSIWDTRLHELEDMGIGVSLYFQFLKVIRIQLEYPVFVSWMCAVRCGSSDVDL